MIRKILYTLLITAALIWGGLKLYGVVMGQSIDLMSYLPAALGNIELPPGALNLFGLVCFGLTAILYLTGAVNIYRHAGRDPWRAVLYTVALLLGSLGIVFFQMQQADMIDPASLGLIAIMVVPFLPPLLFLPLRTTFRDYLAKAKN